MAVYVCFLVALIGGPSFSGESSPFIKLTSNCDNRVPEINDKGVVTWWAFCDGEDHIFMAEGSHVYRLTEGDMRGQNPHINSSGSLVWRGEDKNGKTGVIFYKNKEIKTLTDDTITIYASPALNSRDEVVWQGVIQETDKKGRPLSVNALFLFDGKKTKRVYTDVTSAQSPAINNNGAIVFQGWVNKSADYEKGRTGGYGYAGAFEIFMVDENGILKKLTDSRPDMDNQSPHINDRGMVVWSGLADENNTEIYLYDGNTTKRLSNNKSQDRRPRINNSGDVVWYGSDGRYSQIFHYDGKTVRQITNSSYNNMDPSINNRGDVVWAAQIGQYNQIQVTHIKHEAAK